jgi:phage/plasmid-associated DNA primase
VWYDKFPGMPPRGSPLETVFILIKLQRQQSELLSTRALVQSLVALNTEGKAAVDPAIEAFQKYCDTMFPFLENAADSEKTMAHKRLMEFVKRPARIALHPIYKQQAERAKTLAAQRRFRLTPKMPGTR